MTGASDVVLQPAVDGRGAALVSTKWAAQYIGRKTDVAIRTQLREQNLSFGSERTKAQLPDGQLSWWEMVWLDAFQHLAFGGYRGNAQLRDGLPLLQFPLRPFVIARAPGSLPVLLKPDQVLSYQMETSGHHENNSAGAKDGADTTRRPAHRRNSLLPDTGRVPQR